MSSSSIVTQVSALDTQIDDGGANRLRRGGPPGGDLDTGPWRLRRALNPGHLVGLDEWMHSPIRPGSSERLVSGMAFQVDIIPVPMPDGVTLNCEDAVTFADAGLRATIAERYPALAARFAARRRFVADELGVEVKNDMLLLSAIPLCLPPFRLAPQELLVRN